MYVFVYHSSSSEKIRDDWTWNTRYYCLLLCLCSQSAWKQVYSHQIKCDFIHLTYNIKWFFKKPGKCRQLYLSIFRLHRDFRQQDFSSMNIFKMLAVISPLLTIFSPIVNNCLSNILTCWGDILLFLKVTNACYILQEF